MGTTKIANNDTGRAPKKQKTAGHDKKKLHCLRSTVV